MSRAGDTSCDLNRQGVKQKKRLRRRIFTPHQVPYGGGVSGFLGQQAEVGGGETNDDFVHEDVTCSQGGTAALHGIVRLGVNGAHGRRVRPATFVVSVFEFSLTHTRGDSHTVIRWRSDEETA